MQIHLIAVGERMPTWVQQGYDEYAKRLPRECRLVLKEISPGRRGKNADLDKAVKDEGARMLAALPVPARVVALDIPGQALSTAQLAAALKHWLADGQPVALLVGGPEGLAEAVKRRSQDSWSLSHLTLPHPLVRIVIAEQIYRAWSLINHHPYHR